MCKTYRDLVGHIMLSEDIAFDHTSLLCLCDIGHAVREDGIAIISTTVAGEEADQSLKGELISNFARSKVGWESPEDAEEGRVYSRDVPRKRAYYDWWLNWPRTSQRNCSLPMRTDLKLMHRT